MGSLTVTLPDDLESALDARVADTEFASLEEYTLFILQEVAERDDRQEDDHDRNTEDVEERLEELGYL